MNKISNLFSRISFVAMVVLAITYDMYFPNDIRVPKLPVPGIIIFICHRKIPSDTVSSDTFKNNSFQDI